MVKDTKRHDATELSIKQSKALEALLSGRTISQVATEADVHRSTIHPWRSEPTFLASLNAERSELQSAVRSRLDRLQFQAIDAIEGALRAGDARIALSVLKGMGYLNGEMRRFGPTTAEGIERGAEQARRNSELLASLGVTPRDE